MKNKFSYNIEKDFVKVSLLFNREIVNYYKDRHILRLGDNHYKAYDMVKKYTEHSKELIDRLMYGCFLFMIIDVNKNGIFDPNIAQNRFILNLGDAILVNNYYHFQYKINYQTKESLENYLNILKELLPILSHNYEST